MNNDHDIIIIIGRTAVGKTTASNFLREWASLHRVPYENDAITDGQSFLEVMRLDDMTGGTHHTHDWCEEGVKGHSHNLGQPVLPFTALDDELPTSMFAHFFSRLAELPKTNKTWFVEWAAGANTHPLYDPASHVNLSCTKARRMMQEGSLVMSWLKRVHAVIYVVTDDTLRTLFNERDWLPSSEEIKKGAKSWFKSEQIQRFYERDDFSEIESLFQDTLISIYNLKNEGNSLFFERLKEIAHCLFPNEPQ